MELVDLLLHEAEVLPAREDLPVSEQLRRAGDAVEPVRYCRGLVAGEVHRAERLVGAARDARLGAARRLEQPERRIAQDRDRHLAVEIDVLDELHEMEVRAGDRSEEHTSELQSRLHLVCRLLLEKKKNKKDT